MRETTRTVFIETFIFYSLLRVLTISFSIY
jgi:hypothetical protein